MLGCGKKTAYHLPVRTFVRGPFVLCTLLSTCCMLGTGVMIPACEEGLKGQTSPCWLCPAAPSTLESRWGARYLFLSLGSHPSCVFPSLMTPGLAGLAHCSHCCKEACCRYHCQDEDKGGTNTSHCLSTAQASGENLSYRSRHPARPLPSSEAWGIRMR